MNELLKFEETEIKIVKINEEPYFEIYSVGMALGQVKKAKGKLYPHKDRINKNLENAEIQPVVRNAQLYINESQLYDLMLEMKTDKVKPFRKWIVNEVLPTIRKTGGYIQENRAEEFVDNYFPSLSDETKIILIKDLQKTVLELKPKAEIYDEIMNADGYLSMNETAKIVGVMGRNKLFKFLRQEEILTKKDNCNIPYQRYISSDYFRVVESKDKRGNCIATTIVTPKGVEFITKLIKNNRKLVG